MSSLSMKLREISATYRVHLFIILLLAAYALYLYDITNNPPGFYLDESLLSYNAYLLATTGRGEFGGFLPLYFPVLQIPPPHNYLGYADPTQVYLLGALFLFFPPSIWLPRALSATTVFLACVLLGLLGKRISGRTSVGVIVGATGLVTPWLFEPSRLAFGAALYPLAVVSLLWSLYKAYGKELWSPWNVAAVAGSLALVTYTYSIGRLLGPLLASGIILFASSRKGLRNVFMTWAAYALTLIPLVIFHFQNPGALTGRFNMSVGIPTEDRPYSEIISTFLSNFIANISPNKLLVVGDPNLRHHITDTPAIFLATLILAVLGIVLIGVNRRKDRWCLYVLFGLVASIVPASLTRDQFHSLRLIAVPVFLLTLTIPALEWFLDTEKSTGKVGQAASVGTRRVVLGALLFLTVAQAVLFQISYRDIGGVKRGLWFDDAYPKVLDAALQHSERPIYLIDGAWGQAYLHAYWWALTKGVELSNFVHMPSGQRPPVGSLVLSSEEKCTNCQMILKEGTYLLYRESAAGSPPPQVKNEPPPGEASVFGGGTGNELGKFRFPHGLATDGAGNIYVADTGNGRIQKFSPDGTFISSFCEGVCKAPKAIAIANDHILVLDDGTNRLMRFKTSDLAEAGDWTVASPSLAGASDIAIDPGGNVYVADQGNARIIKFSPSGQILLTWGSVGEADGQFRQITGVSASADRVYVADARNSRVQYFDTTGKWLGSVPIAEWAVPEGWQSPDILFDAKANRLYVSSSATHEVFVYDGAGQRLEKVDFGNLSGTTALAFGPKGQLYALNTLSANVSQTKVDAK